MCGVLCAAGLYVVLSSGSLPGPVPLVLAVAVIVFVPSAQVLARRLTLNLALVVGWAPLLWWVDWPGSVNHAALILSTAFGGTLAVLVGGTDPRSRLRRLVPKVGLADTLLLLSVGAATVTMHKWAFVSSPRQALERLVPGADNYAHFNMFASLRAYGATPGALGQAPDGSGWAFDNYPKSFHSLVATISELTSPHLSTGPESLLSYTRGVSVLVVLGTLLVTATILSLPGLAGRPAVAAPVVVLTWTALLWEPGQKVLANGFASFWLGTVAAGCALLIGLSGRRPPAIVEIAAVGGLLVCVAHTWLPLLVIAAPAAVAVLVPGRKGGLSTTQSRPGRLAVVVLLVVAAAAAVLEAAVTLLSTVEVGFVVSEVSGFDGTSPIPTFLLLVLGCYLLSSYGSWSRRGGRDGVDPVLRRRLQVLAVSLLLGVVSLMALLVAQIQTIGTTSYYFLKYLLGFELILAVVVPALAGMLIAGVARAWTSRPLAATAGLVAVLGATVFFGPLSPRDALMFSETDDGTASVAPPYTRAGIAEGVLAAAATSTARESFHMDYLPLGRGNAAQLFYPDGWYHAVHASVTNDVWKRFALLRQNADGPDDAVPIAREVLLLDPALTLMVPPGYVEAVRGGLGSEELARRVVPLGAATSGADGSS